MLNPSMNRCLGGALIALALISAQAGRADDKTVNLLVKPKAGTVTKYKTTIKASVMGMEVSIVESEQQTIKEVKDDGNVVLVTEGLGGTISLNGTDMPQPPTPPVTTTRDKLGKLVEFKSDTQEGSPFTPEVQRLIAAISENLLSDKDVKEGDSWETEVENPVSKDNKVKAKTTYVGMEKVEGVDCWKIKQTAEAVAGMNGQKLSYEATSWMNPKDGIVQKVEAKLKDVPSQIPQVETISFEMKMSLDKGDKTADPKKDKDK